jgi:hypothetical protein
VPMFQAVAIFLVTLILTAAAAVYVERLRTDLLRPIFWLILIAVAGMASAASAIVANTRHAGTGFTTSYGWPKPFYFHYLSEAGEQSRGLDIIYFVGNTLVFAGALLIIWTVSRVSGR